MAMSVHVTGDTLRRLHRRELPSAEVADALRHVQACAECCEAAWGELGPEIRAALESVEEPFTHPEEDAIVRYVDGAASAAEREIVASHLDDCAMCRAEMESLAELRVEAPVGSRVWRFVASSGLAAAAMLSLVFLLREPTRVTPPPVAPTPAPVVTTTTPPDIEEPAIDPRWAALMESALRDGRLPYPAYLATLRASSTTLRNEDGAPSGRWVRPAGVVVDDERPRFEWSGVDDASYVVSVFDGDSEVAHSPSLTTPRWQIDRPLRRGRIYTWQVEVTRNGEIEILPSPEQALARFRVTSTGEHREIAAALARHPDEPLLHAVLYARAGMVAEAEQAWAKR